MGEVWGPLEDASPHRGPSLEDASPHTEARTVTVYVRARSVTVAAREGPWSLGAVGYAVRVCSHIERKG
jgi:hypothetical protein